MTTSYPSYGAFVFDVPEPGSFSGQFIYNFYVSNERTSINTHIVEEVDGEEKDYGYARYIQLELTPPVDASLLSAVETIDIEAAEKAAILNTYYDTLNSEHTIQGNNFSTITLEDSEISGDVTAAIIEAAATQSGFTNLGLADALSLMSTTKDVLDVDALMNGAQIDSANEYSYYDPSLGTAVQYSQTEENGEFSMTFAVNNKFLSDILAFSESAPLSSLFGKIDSDLSSAASTQAGARAGQDSSLLSIDQYMPTMQVMSEESSTSSDSGFMPGIAFMGYVVDKSEIIDSSTEEFITRAFFTGDSADALDSVADYEVKYGSTYCYQISTVYLLRWNEYSASGEDTITTQKYSLVKSRSAPKAVVECVEKIPPEPPSGVEFHRNSNGTIKIIWTPGANPQLDVVKYQVFRRSSIDDPFVLQMEIDFDYTEDQQEPSENVPSQYINKVEYQICSYTDSGFDNESDYIYAICAVDTHMLSSNYSAQYRVKYDKTNGQLDISWISPKGSPKPYPNFLIPGILTEDSIKDSLHSYLKIYFTPDYYKILDADGVDSQFIPWTNANDIGGARMQIINLDRQNSKNIRIRFKDQRTIS